MRIFLALVLLAPAKALAFPEMVRHHYVNCNTCHVSPGGGGLLTEYGRGMSGEVLSSWSMENEALFLHGALKPGKMPEALNVGGNLRFLQAHRETRQVREGRYILMQSSLEAALTAGPLTAVAAFGEPDALNHVHGAFTRFYLLGNLTETVQLRAGRFLPAFGLNVPHHILSTRQPLGFGSQGGRDAVEGHYSGEQWHGALGWSVSRPESALRQRERALSAQLERFFADSHRVGASLWWGESETQKRVVSSLHGILGFSERIYLLTETAPQNRQAKARGLVGPTETGVFHFGRFGYEVARGLHLTAVEDLAKSNVAKPDSFSMLLGAGPVWYPRPHFELELLFAQRKVLRTSREFEDYAYLMLHYYL